MVEIGGEVKVSGKNIQKKPWNIGVDYPLTNTNPGEKIVGIVSLEDRSMATSGNYRNFFEHGSKKYSHIINPKNGLGLTTNHAVVVISNKGSMSDALATSISILGKSGLKILNHFQCRRRAFRGLRGKFLTYLCAVWGYGRVLRCQLGFKTCPGVPKISQAPKLQVRRPVLDAILGSKIGLWGFSFGLRRF